MKKLMSDLSLRERIVVANMQEEDLDFLQSTSGGCIKEDFRLSTGNGRLMEYCRAFAGLDMLHEDDASAVIIKELWKKLRESYILRVVK